MNIDVVDFRLSMLLQVLLLNLLLVSLSSQAKEAQLVQTITVPLYENLSLDLPVTGELSSWSSGYYVWRVDQLFIDLDKDKVWTINPFSLDIVISQAPREDFNYSRWRQGIVDSGALVIREDAHGMLYQSGGALHILTHYYTGKEHVLGKATLFDVEDLNQANISYEVLSSFIPKHVYQGYQSRFVTPLDIKTTLANMPITTEPWLAKALSDTIPSYLNGRALLSADTQNWKPVDTKQSKIPLKIYAETELGTLEYFADTAQEDGWSVAFIGENQDKSKVNRLTLQNMSNPTQYFSYCLVEAKGVELILSASEDVHFRYMKLAEQLSFIHQCQLLDIGDMIPELHLPQLTTIIKPQLFRYSKIEPLITPKGWLKVFDKTNNPDNFFWGAVGVLDADSKVIIEPKFEEIEFIDNFFLATKKSGKVLISFNGNPLIEGSDFTSLSAGKFLVTQEEGEQSEMGVFDANNNVWLMAPALHDLRPFENTQWLQQRVTISGTNGVKQLSYYGLVELDGRVVVPPEFQSLWLNRLLDVIVVQQISIDTQNHWRYRYGVYKSNGELIMPVIYDGLEQEMGAVIKLRKEGEWWQYPDSSKLNNAN
ncbi:WG repeat-containing protein [Shewanella woodyi]|uniref:KWG Leptospira repeat protein n=1 Tax=Shewanella woodyi (strain ATCC 51908 / MS32) TaxID=392500 RepID=B1KH39_SHEWM|nr:WG repeat-containing protein [Shewanella woodyi]ACA88351.1 hypothetical protein Swoo_4095 [Shewanella woodyi ATCC 51908]